MRAELSWATTDAEKEAVYRLRYRINVEGQGFFKQEADHAHRRLEDSVDACSRIVIAKVDGQIVGTVRLQWGGEAKISERLRREYDIRRFDGVVDECNVLIATRIMVSPEYRGQGLAVRLLKEVFGFAASQGVDLILGRCEFQLVDYYRKLGFRPFGDVYVHPTNGPRRLIAVLTADEEYLRQIGSPMLVVLLQRRQEARRLEELRTLLGEGSPRVEPALLPAFSRKVLSRKVLSRKVLSRKMLSRKVPADSQVVCLQ